MTPLLRQIIFVISLVTLLIASPSSLRAEQFRVALLTKDFGYLPLFVAMRSGLFAQENLEIQWIVVNNNVVVTALMAPARSTSPASPVRPCARRRAARRNSSRSNRPKTF